MVDYTAIADNEAKIAALEVEKEELLKELKNVKTTEATGKISEARRKRVQELEQQIIELKKKLQEQGRLIKMKEKNEIKIKQLNNEITQMKQMKVKLIKNIKQESEKFRVWKLQKEQDINRLKAADRKKENEIVKMKNMYNRQQNVLKRKMEEAAAINKRLKDALALRKNVQDQKNSGKVERLGHWLQEELEICVSTVHARSTLDNLMEDRATLQNQLDQLQAAEDADPAEIKQIERDIELRSVQIQELQQKVLDSDEGKFKIIISYQDIP